MGFGCLYILFRAPELVLRAFWFGDTYQSKSQVCGVHSGTLAGSSKPPGSGPQTPTLGPGFYYLVLTGGGSIRSGTCICGGGEGQTGKEGCLSVEKSSMISTEPGNQKLGSGEEELAGLGLSTGCLRESTEEQLGQVSPEVLPGTRR